MVGVPLRKVKSKVAFTKTVNAINVQDNLLSPELSQTTDDGNTKAPDLFETLHITLFVDLGMLFLAPHVSELRSLSRGLKHLCLLAGNAMSGF